MKTITIIIEKTENTYHALAINLKGVTGSGNTAVEAQAAAAECLNDQIELGNIPDIDYELVFQEDDSVRS